MLTVRVCSCISWAVAGCCKQSSYQGICQKLHNAMMVWSTELEWEAENGDRRRGDAQAAVWTTQLELQVRSEGRNTRNTSAPAVEEEVVVFLHVTHECSCGSRDTTGQ